VYHIAVYFDVPEEKRDVFIAAAHEDGRNSARTEPGTRRFELIEDEERRNRFYLNEAYDDAEAFDVHAKGPHFERFFSIIGDFAQGPEWLLRGHRIDDPLEADAGAFTLVAEFEAKAGREQDLRRELLHMVEPSLAEPGCLGYRPLIDPADDRRMIIVEEWSSEAALEEHFATPHFRKVAAALEEILERPFTLSRLTRHPEAA
jgi:(4S)-4-hydroxy-5-phosphonooxypentane-2,3-dione isomerase